MAHCFLGIRGRPRIAPKHVFANGDSLEMRRIDACVVAAQVVND
jgi:hypothetical protein